MGAGASYGKREKDSNGKDIPGRITEGLPTVDEIPMRLEKVKEIFEQPVFKEDDVVKNENTNNSKSCWECQRLLVEDFKWLIENAKKHATIDTFARKESYLPSGGVISCSTLK